MRSDVSSGALPFLARHITRTLPDLCDLRLAQRFGFFEGGQIDDVLRTVYAIEPVFHEFRIAHRGASALTLPNEALFICGSIRHWVSHRHAAMHRTSFAISKANCSLFGDLQRFFLRIHRLGEKPADRQML
jgi:hypothetical protein